MVRVLRRLLLGQLREQVDDRPVGIVQLRIALAPESVPRLLVRRAARVEQLGIHAVNICRRLALERAADGVAAARALPVRVEHLHHRLRVEHVAEPTRQLCLDVILALGALGKLEAELTVEGERARHVADDDPERLEARSHAAATSASCRAATTLRMCSSRSRPSPSAPAYTSSRWTPAANDGCFSFFLTDLGSMPSRPPGRTSATAWTKPDSSSHAKSVFFSCVSRGIDRCSAWESTASTTSSG